MLRQLQGRLMACHLYSKSTPDLAVVLARILPLLSGASPNRPGPRRQKSCGCSRTAGQPLTWILHGLLVRGEAAGVAVAWHPPKGHEDGGPYQHKTANGTHAPERNTAPTSHQQFRDPFGVSPWGSGRFGFSSPWVRSGGRCGAGGGRLVVFVPVTPFALWCL